MTPGMYRCRQCVGPTMHMYPSMCCGVMAVMHGARPGLDDGQCVRSGPTGRVFAALQVISLLKTILGALARAPNQSPKLEDLMVTSLTWVATDATRGCSNERPARRIHLRRSPLATTCINRPVSPQSLPHLVCWQTTSSKVAHRCQSDSWQGPST